MSEQTQDSNLAIPAWIVSQIGRLNIEIEYLRNENTALRSTLAGHMAKPAAIAEEDAE